MVAWRALVWWRLLMVAMVGLAVRASLRGWSVWNAAPLQRWWREQDRVQQRQGLSFSNSIQHKISHVPQKIINYNLLLSQSGTSFYHFSTPPTKNKLLIFFRTFIILNSYWFLNTLNILYTLLWYSLCWQNFTTAIYAAQMSFMRVKFAWGWVGPDITIYAVYHLICS